MPIHAQSPVSNTALDLLFERSCTLAERVFDGQLGFIDAIDMAYTAADFAGLVDRYGDDTVQMVLADAFGGWQ